MAVASDPLVEALVHEADRHGYRLGLVPPAIVGTDVDHGLTATQYPAITSEGVALAVDVYGEFELEGIDPDAHPVGRTAKVLAEDLHRGSYAEALAAAVAARAMACADALADDGRFDLAYGSADEMADWLTAAYGFSPAYALQVVNDALFATNQLDSQEV